MRPKAAGGPPGGGPTRHVYRRCSPHQAVRQPAERPSTGGGIEKVERGANAFETDINVQIKDTDGRAVFWNVMVHRWVEACSTTGWATTAGCRGSEET